MFKIGLLGSTTPTSPIVLSPINWANALALNTVTTGSGLVTWPTTQPTVDLRIVTTNIIQQNPFIGNTAGSFRVITNTANDPNPAGGAVITTYASLDFTIAVPNNTYVWFRLGPAETAREITVYNASNGNALVDTVTLTTGPLANPIFISLLGAIRNGSGVTNYTLQTVQFTNIPTTPTPNVNLYFTASLTNGPALPNFYYAINYPGITGPGVSNINGATSSPTALGFTLITLGSLGTNISIPNGTLVTLLAEASVPYPTAGTVSSPGNAILNIVTNTGNTTIAQVGTMKVYDI